MGESSDSPQPVGFENPTLTIMQNCYYDSGSASFGWGRRRFHGELSTLNLITFNLANINIE
ncbi:MAG: hypothetical protein U9N54_12405 [candidate division Zixibacteria bacterium]|nr:hypothetical protein [candidate division Zixibacteria bacterium]